MGVWIVRPGMLLTVQDHGRWGYQRFGVPVSGPMDGASHRLANLLVGNRPSAATLEVTLVGPELEFDDDTLFAVTGAEFDLQTGGAATAMNSTVRARRGHRLVFGERRHGARAYVAVAGGFDVPLVLGSRATHLGSRIGGFEGRGLKSGDRLPIGQEIAANVREGETRSATVAMPIGGSRVRLLLGPDNGLFDPTTFHTSQRARYVLTTQSDRMGYRLRGERLVPRRQTELISTATPVGSVQVPPSGYPLVLMADRQTSGGYPRIGTVISADLPVAGQLAPGDWIEFESCSDRLAYAALIAQERTLMA